MVVWFLTLFSWKLVWEQKNILLHLAQVSMRAMGNYHSKHFLNQFGWVQLQRERSKHSWGASVWLIICPTFKWGNSTTIISWVTEEKQGLWKYEVSYAKHRSSQNLRVLLLDYSLNQPIRDASIQTWSLLVRWFWYKVFTSLSFIFLSFNPFIWYSLVQATSLFFLV